MTKKNIMQTMLRCIKFIFIFATILFLTTYLFLTIFINHYFSKNDLNFMVIGHLQDFFNRPVKIESSNLNFNGNIKIKNIYIYKKDFKGFLLKSLYILVKLNPHALLKGNLEINSIKLISPEINLIKEDDETWNFQDIIERNKKSTNKKSINLSAIEIEDGRINIEDRKNGYKHFFKNINLQTGSFNFSEPVSFTFSSFFKSDYLTTKEDNRLFLEGLLSPIKDSFFSIKNINSEISINETAIKLSGEITSLKPLNSNLELNMPQIDLKKIFKDGKNLIIPSSKIKLNITEDIKGFSLHGFIDSINTSFNASILPLKLKISYNLDLIFNKVNAEKIKFLMDKYVKEPKGIINLNIFLKGDFSKGIEKNNITAEFFKSKFKDYYGIFEFNDAEGKFITQNHFSALNITKTSAILKNNLIKDMSFKWESSQNTELFSSFLNMAGKKVKIRGNIKRKNGTPEISTFMIYNQSTNLDEILSIIEYCREKINQQTKEKKNSGKYDFYNKHIKLYYKSDKINNKYGIADKIYYYSDIFSFIPSLKQISANFKTKIFNGKFYDIEENAEKNDIYYLISLPITTLYKLNRFGALKIQSQLKEVEFSEIGADYTLNNGKIIINSFYINGKDFMAYTTGNIDLNEEKLDIVVYTINQKYYSMGGLPEALTDAKGRPAIAFKVKGKFKKTDIKILDPNYNLNIIKDAINKGINLETKIMDNF